MYERNLHTSNLTADALFNEATQRAVRPKLAGVTIPSIVMFVLLYKKYEY